MLVEISTPPILAPTGPARTEGIHVSGVIRQIALLNRILDPQYVESLDLVDRSDSSWWDRLDPSSKLRMSLGLAWEPYYITQVLREQEVLHQPGEMCVEGIYMTHDGESLETVFSERGTAQTVLALHEVKLTYKSWNTIKDIRSQWMWLAQVKAYCKGLGTCLAYLHVCCVCGDYSFPITPFVRRFKLVFTPLEIEENWEILTGFVRHYQQQQAEDAMRDTE